MRLTDIPEAEYIVFEHGTFDYEQENRSVEDKIEKAMAAFDYEGTDYRFDPSPVRHHAVFAKILQPFRTGLRR